MFSLNLKSQNGNISTMAIVGTILILSTLGYIVANMTSSSHTMMNVEAEEQRAFYAAQSGLEYGLKEYLASDNISEWTKKNLKSGSGTTATIKLSKVGNDKIKITSTGRSGTMTQTVETIISDTDSNYVPDYAVFSKKPVLHTETKDVKDGETKPGLVYENAPSVPVFDLDVLRKKAKITQDDGNSYYYTEDLVVDESLNPPDGTIVFTEGKLKFAKGTWKGNVHFVAMDDISFLSSWRNSDDVAMTVYSGDPKKKVWVEPRNFDDDPVEFEIKDGEVIPSEPFNAKVTILGCAFASYDKWGNKIYDAPITVRLKMGKNSKITPFGPDPSKKQGQKNKDKVYAGNVNKPGEFPFEYTFPNSFEQGTSIAIRARAWARTHVYNSNSNLFHYDQARSDKDSKKVWVLRDGDRVPDVQGFGNQKSAEDFIGNYVDFNTRTVTLDDNQAIYLFELSKLPKNNPGTDYQDLVALISLAKEGSDVEIGGGEEMIKFNTLSFSGGIISHGTVNGRSVDTISKGDEGETEEVVTQLQVVRNEQIIKDFLKLSVNGNARVILNSKWSSKN